MFSNQVDMAQHNWSFQDNIIKIMNTPYLPYPPPQQKESGNYINGQKSQHVALFWFHQFHTHHPQFKSN
jgi:hypothetical protein